VDLRLSRQNLLPVFSKAKRRLLLTHQSLLMVFVRWGWKGEEGGEKEMQICYVASVERERVDWKTPLELHWE